MSEGHDEVLDGVEIFWGLSKLTKVWVSYADSSLESP
jgi:hypothetical protein